MLNIRQRQMNLQFLNYNCGGIDGIEGQKTRQAYRNFQRDFECLIDGKYGPETDRRLISIIDDIQARVGAKVDGVAGNETIEKTKEWQRNHGLVPDGIAGTQTRNAMANVCEISWDDIKYFSKNDMTCKCGCGLNNTDLRLMQIADRIREHFGSLSIITSGCRCSKHNAEVGGVQRFKTRTRKRNGLLYSRCTNTRTFKLLSATCKRRTIKIYIYKQYKYEWSSSY